MNKLKHPRRAADTWSSERETLQPMRHGPQRFNLYFLLLLPCLVGGCTWLEEMRFAPQLAKADQAFNQRHYPLAVSRYESLIDRYPRGERRGLLRFRQGIGYYAMGDYHDAEDAFRAYLKEYPDGLHEEEAGVYLGKIAALTATDGPVQAQALEEAKADLDKLEQLRAEHPHDPEVLVALGHLDYELGNYEQAVRYYYEAIKINAALEERAFIQDRMMLDEKGRPVPITPEALDAIEREQRPLIIYDTNKYRSRDLGDRSHDAGRGDLRYFNVAGKVRNQSTRLLHNVEIEVRFHDVHNNLLDVKHYRVGSMAPQEVRAFRVDSSSYDSLYNVYGYTTSVTWQ